MSSPVQAVPKLWAHPSLVPARRGIPQHCLIFSLGTAVVTLAVTVDDHNMVTIDVLNKYILGGQYIHTGLVRVVYDIPELLDEFLWVRQIHRMQGFI